MKKKSGFTLIELSIVLVIIGLIVGGVLVGKDLIEAAQLRSIVTKQQNLETAILAFRNKFNELPGDFSKAGQIWGQFTVCFTENKLTPVDTTTCSGNGDKRIYNEGGTSQTGKEEGSVWHHLKLGGLMDDAPPSIHGYRDGGFARSLLYGDTSVMPGQPGMDDVTWGVGYIPVVPTNQGFYPAVASRHIMFLSRAGGSNAQIAPSLKPIEALSIDSKIDDGSPASGRFLTTVGESGSAYENGNMQLVNGVNVFFCSVAGEYNLDNEERACAPIFLTNF